MITNEDIQGLLNQNSLNQQDAVNAGLLPARLNPAELETLMGSIPKYQVPLDIPNFTRIGDRYARTGGFNTLSREQLQTKTQAEIDAYEEQRKEARGLGIAEGIRRMGMAFQGKDPYVADLKRQELELRRMQLQQGKDRRIVVQDGIQYYVDTGERVLPNVAQTPDTKDSFGNEDKLRDDYIKSSSEFIDVRNSFDRILSVTNKEPTAAGDLSLIFNYMKMLDPGSTVREGEFATAKNSAGVDDRLRALYNGMVEGERLAPNTRADFVNQAFNLYEGQQSIQEMNMDYWKNLAKEYDFKENRIVQNYGAPLIPKIFKSKIRIMSDIDLAKLDLNALTKEQEEVVKKELKKRTP